MNLNNFTDDELRSELERREKIIQAESRPKQVDNPDFTLLRRCCQEYIDELDSRGWVDEDYDHYIFEAAMTAIFGKDVFKWINEKMK